MDNQHRKISGYRELSQEEIDLMNEGKALAEQYRQFIQKLESKPNEVDFTEVQLAKSNLQQGFMWITKSIAKPDSF